jgi:hypothetical protein
VRNLQCGVLRQGGRKRGCGQRQGASGGQQIASLHGTISSGFGEQKIAVSATGVARGAVGARGSEAPFMYTLNVMIVFLYSISKYPYFELSIRMRYFANENF